MKKGVMFEVEERNHVEVEFEEMNPVEVEGRTHVEVEDGGSCPK
jgi:hypothetical protein